MELISVFLPFFSFLTIALFGRHLGIIGSSIISVICLLFTVIYSFVLLNFIILQHQTKIITLGNWFEVALFKVDWSFIFDPLSVIMLFTVSFISLFVHIYSISYLEGDPHIIRFLSYLNLFTFFMLFLVVSNNLVLFFFGWEGIGLTSYLLINFWHTRINANKAAIKAILVNRIGDFGFLLGLTLTYTVFGSVDFNVIFALAPYIQNYLFNVLTFNFEILNVICFCFVLGLMGKSAQLGLHTWLPDAMEGPTPVSALIHAATLVTAGVFLILRLSFLYEFANSILIFLTILGAITAFFAATVAITQFDIKRIIAYSTCSQLGYMVFACGISQYNAAFFHLVNHAFFKSLLFLGAGSVIHALLGEQDIRKMGGLAKILPFTFVAMLTGSLSLAGFPFLTGYYSKDFILLSTFLQYTFVGRIAFLLGIITAFLTAFYSFRLLYNVFYSIPRFKATTQERIHESSVFISLPLFVLSICSIFFGFLFKDSFVNIGTDFWQNTLYIRYNHYFFFHFEFLPSVIKFIPVVSSLSAILLAYLCFEYLFKTKTIRLLYLNFIFNNNLNSKLIKSFLYFYSFLINKWYFDYFYNNYFIKSFLYFSYHISYKILDAGILYLLQPEFAKRLLRLFLNFFSLSVYNKIVILVFLGLNVMFFYLFLNDLFEEIPTNFYLIILIVFYNIKTFKLTEKKLKSNFNFLKYYGIQKH